MNKFLSLLLITSSLASASSFKGISSYSFGMQSTSVTENESQLTQTDTSVSQTEKVKAEVKAVSAIGFEINYEFDFKQKRSYFVRASVPMMSPDGSGLFLGGVGFNWYFNDLGSIYVMNLNGHEITMVPKIRYWAGMSTGLGYLIYNTVSSKKSDIVFDLAAQVGGAYALNTKWGIRAEAIIGKGTGVATSTMNMRMNIGLNYFL